MMLFFIGNCTIYKTAIKNHADGTVQYYNDSPTVEKFPLTKLPLVVKYTGDFNNYNCENLITQSNTADYVVHTTYKEDSRFIQDQLLLSMFTLFILPTPMYEVDNKIFTTIYYKGNLVSTYTYDLRRITLLGILALPFLPFEIIRSISHDTVSSKDEIKKTSCSVYNKILEAEYKYNQQFAKDEKDKFREVFFHHEKNQETRNGIGSTACVNLQEYIQKKKLENYASTAHCKLNSIKNWSMDTLKTTEYPLNYNVSCDCNVTAPNTVINKEEISIVNCKLNVLDPSSDCKYKVQTDSTDDTVYETINKSKIISNAKLEETKDIPISSNQTIYYIGKLSWNDASTHCKAKGLKLPSIEEFKVAFKSNQMSKLIKGFYWSLDQADETSVGMDFSTNSGLVSSDRKDFIKHVACFKN